MRYLVAPFALAVILLSLGASYGEEPTEAEICVAITSLPEGADIRAFDRSWEDLVRSVEAQGWKVETSRGGRLATGDTLFLRLRIGSITPVKALPLVPTFSDWARKQRAYQWEVALTLTWKGERAKGK